MFTASQTGLKYKPLSIDVHWLLWGTPWISCNTDYVAFLCLVNSIFVGRRNKQEVNSCS